MKKLLSAMLALALLAGCSNSSSGGSSSGGNSATNDKIEIEFWYSGGKTVVNQIQDIVDEYNASQDKYVVKTVTQADYTETFQKVQAGIAGKAGPDIVLLDTAPARMLFEKGLVADLRKFQDADPNYNADDYFEVYADQAKYTDGGIFARPMYGTIQICYYNIEAFEKADIDPLSIKSWQDMAEAGKKIKDAGYDYGWEPMGGDGKNLIDAAFANGAKVLSDDGKTVTINSPEWVEVWESFRGWIHDDEIMTTHWGGQGWQYWYDTIGDVMDGKAGGYTGSPADTPDLDFNIVQPMEQPGWNDKVSMPWAQALMLSILSDSPEEEQAGAYDFLNYLTSPENHAAFLMVSGYAAVNKKVADVEKYQKYMEENPVAAVLLTQSEHAAVYPVDPTGGAILDALNVAASKIEVDNVSAKEALDEAQKIAQTALDEALSE